MKLIVILSVVFAGLAHGYPSRIALQPNRRAYMFGGYYANPLFGRSYDHVPQGAMSAVVTQDTVATNSFAGPNQIPLGPLPLEGAETSEQVTERNYPPLDVQQTEIDAPHQQNVPSQAQGQEVFLDEETGSFNGEVSTQASVVTKSPKKKSSRKSKKQQPQPQNEEEENDEEEEETAAAGAWPFGGARGVPSYNAFFPITISGPSPSGRRSRPSHDNEDYAPAGSATAIANAFSTGKGGIATSHATSLGDPYLTAMFLRDGMLSFRNKKPEQDA